MFKAIADFFSQNIVAEEERATDGEHALRLATAALLFEMMRMDESIHASEREVACRVLQDKFGLEAAETEQLLALAEQEAAESTDYYQFTSLINRHFSPEKKVKVVELLWRVAYADGRLDRYEEHLVRKLAELLYVSHTDYIAAKHRALEQGE
jgi:uncharacterized tellurite resistance protein B-like protein